LQCRAGDGIPVLLVALPWLVLLFATRGGIWSRPARRRAMLVVGTVLAVHLAIQTTLGLSTVEDAILSALPSDLQIRLSHLIGWSVDAYPVEAGASILLVCLALVFAPAVARRWPALRSLRSARMRPAGRRGMVATLATLAVAVPAGEAAYIWLVVRQLRSGAQQRHPSTVKRGVAGNPWLIACAAGRPRPAGRAGATRGAAPRPPRRSRCRCGRATRPGGR
jgi:hypothetical protein